MNSDYCYGTELRRAIKRHERRETRVIPIILSPVDWKIPPLDKLQALPTDARPVTGAGWHSVDDALLNVVKGIRVAIKDLQKRQKPGFTYQYQVNCINEQLKQGTSALAALDQCDPELGKLVEWVISKSPIIHSSEAGIIKAQMEKLLQEVSAVADGDLRVQGEVTPDILGVIADSINYLIEELAKIVGRIRETTTPVVISSNNILKVLDEQIQIAGKLAQILEMLMKSLPEETYSQQFSTIKLFMSDLFKRFDLTGSEIRKIEDSSRQLQASTSMFRLPERTMQY
jgi:methyl-accepting chemotaxis protein